MKCHKVEKLHLKSLEGLSDKDQIEILEQHFRSCPECLRMREDYESILGTLKVSDYPEPKPHFWERLRPKLREPKISDLWAQWKQWGIRAIPVSLLIVVVLAGSLTLFSPKQEEELSSSGAFLLQNRNPLLETGSILEEERLEDKNMMLIFASMEEQKAIEREIP